MDLQPGRELDALVAEKVFGALISDPIFAGSMIYQGKDNQGKDKGFAVSGTIEDVPHYSTDIAAAWEVLEKVREQVPDFGFGIDDKPGEFRTYAVRIGDCMATSISAPHSICLAALKAVGNE
jgi:hypothetical protein